MILTQEKSTISLFCSFGMSSSLLGWLCDSSSVQFLGNWNNDSYSNELIHITNQNASQRRILFISLQTNGLAGDEVHDGCLTGCKMSRRFHIMTWENNDKRLTMCMHISWSCKHHQLFLILTYLSAFFYRYIWPWDWVTVVFYTESRIKTGLFSKPEYYNFKIRIN